MNSTTPRRVTLLALAYLLSGCSSVEGGQKASVAGVDASVQQTAPSDPSIDAPELARLGGFAVGTVIDEFVFPERAMLTLDGVASGRLEKGARILPARIWYPAELSGAAPVAYPHILRRPGRDDLSITVSGIAVADARPLAGQRFPLILISHGYGGWSESMSYLAENLATKGYVVVAPDHLDRPVGADTDGQLDFGNVLLDRSRDQREVANQLLGRTDSGAGYAALIDPNKIGVIGYSMGGFGALTTAGAPYDPASASLRFLPDDARQALLADGGPDISDRIGALVTFAPWGGQPASRMWSSDSLKQITAPVLMIDGDQDDVVDFANGARWVFDQLTTDRYFLVFQGARHNVGNNPVPPGFTGPFATWEFFEEPVWRISRINAINLHFVTAFLDSTLKGDSAKRAYLDVPTPLASDSVWTAAAGQQSEFAGAAQPRHWRGFQRRWALGLELHHSEAEAVTETP